MSKISTDKYCHQKLYYRQHKERLNRRKTLNSYKKKYGEFMANNSRIIEFRQNKKAYLSLKDLNREVLIHFLKIYEII